MIDAIGLIEAGAESPYAEALAWISELLEPDLVEETAGTFKDGTLQSWSVASADISVPDAEIAKQLSGR